MLFFALVLLPLLPSAAQATEIAAGSMLGPRFDPRSFYSRSGPGDVWRKTYSEAGYRRQAQGKLMNLRLAQALFDDEWMREHPFDPEANTDAVIAALDFYRSHGVLMISVSFQGGNPGYSQAANGIDRHNGFRFGPGKGLSVSGFRPDGSLKPAWLGRLERLLRACDERGMVVNLIYFYQGQDEQFESAEAIHAAVRNLTDWLVQKRFRNVIIEIANEWDLRGDHWDFDSYIPQNVPRLMELVRERFPLARADFLAPVTVSSDGRMNYSESLARAVDIVMIHGNGRTPAEKTARTMELRGVPRPVLMNEDDNGRETTRANLARELESCDILFERAAGWGYMPWVQAQRFPFRFLPAAGAAPRDDMPEGERDLAYFHAVLDHIAALVLTRPPHPRPKQQ